MSSETSGDSAGPTGLDPEIRAMLVCPICRGELRDVSRGLLCDHDALVFPVRDGVPWMVRECALRATPEERGGA